MRERRRRQIRGRVGSLPPQVAGGPQPPPGRIEGVQVIASERIPPMRRLILTLLLTGSLVVGVAPAAFGHVHGITPLLELGCKVDNTITGREAGGGGAGS